MRKILFTMALLAVMLFGATMQANAQEPYNPDYKYSFFSNWSIGLAGDVTKTTDFDNWTIGEGLDFGAQLRATKRIGKRWNYRLMADVPATYKFFTENEPTNASFDQYAKLTSGVSLNFLKCMYLFADAGVALDPDAGETFKEKIDVLKTGKGITPVGQAGLGVNIDFGKNNYNRIFLEVGADIRNHYNPALEQEIPFEWKSNLFGYVGYTRCLGVTAKDKRNLAELERCPEEVARLTEENNKLKDETIRCGVTNNELAQSLNKATSLNERLEKELEECRSQKPEEPKQMLFQIYFDYGSYALTELENDKIEILARQMKENGGQYTIDGYCSMPGSDEFNQKLSEKRANAVKEKLVKLGVGDQIADVVGHGRTDKFGDGNPLNQMVSITRK
jgi:outer membrane protein OmpA-like peptidoglycan-associated protein